MMFIEESGNYIYVGFQMANILPYVVYDMNVSGCGNYVTSLARYFEVLSDSVSARAVHKGSGNMVVRDIFSHGGYFYVQ